MVNIVIKTTMDTKDFDRAISGVRKLQKHGFRGTKDTQFKSHMKVYWRDTVYKYYNRRISEGLDVTGQLGEACNISGDGKDYHISMKPIYSNRPSGTYDYGKFLQRDVGMSTGKYMWQWDARSKWGIHGGAKNYSKRWKPFILNLKQEIERFLKIKIEEIIEEDIR